MTAAGPVADEFDAHFKEHIAPHFDALEGQRLVLKEQYKWRLAIAGAGTLGVALLILIANTLFQDIDPQFVFGAPAAAGVGLVLWAQGPRRRFRRGYKEKLLPAIAAYFGHFSYDAEGGIRMSRLNESTLIPSHDRYRHEDLFAGSYRDVGVEFCEAKLTERRGSGKNRRTVTVFNGVFVLLTMNKNFKGKTVVRRDAGKLGNWFQNTFSSLEPVKLEDPEFEKQFEVYSDDQVEARYLLTPAFMTRLMDLCRAMGANRLEAAFFGAQLLIKLPASNAARVSSDPLVNLHAVLGGTGGMFEPGSIFRSVRDTAAVRRITDEFKTILSIVDLLKLHERTGL